MKKGVRKADCEMRDYLRLVFGLLGCGSGTEPKC